MQIKILAAFITVITVTGCATVPQADLTDIQNALHRRLALPASITLAAPSAEEVQRQVQLLLEQPLTPNSALQLALLKNSALHAELAGLGVAQADLVGAGLISNPALAVDLLRPEGGGRWQLDFGLTQSLLNVMTRSLRKSMAQAEYETAQWKVTQHLVATLQQVEAAYYEAITAAHRVAILDVVAEASEANRLLAERFYAAGNIPELQYLREAGEAKQRRLAVEEAQAEAEQARLALATHLGLVEADALQLPMQLPDLPDEKFIVSPLVESALAQRLDLQILMNSHQRVERQLALYLREGGFETLDLGIHGEREPEGLKSYGPALEISLPVFHQGQPRIAAAKARLAQKTYQVQALRIVIQNEVAQALSKLQASRRKVEFLRTHLIPLRERIVRLSMQSYNFMLTGVSEALSAKQNEYEAYLDYVQGLNQYWQARAALSMAIGGGLPTPELTPAPLPTLAPEDSMQKMNHGQHGGMKGMNQSPHDGMKRMKHSPQGNMQDMDHSQHEGAPVND